LSTDGGIVAFKDVCSASTAVSKEELLLKVESVSEQDDLSGMADEGLGRVGTIKPESRA
jgi:hypothetical protein